MNCKNTEIAFNNLRKQFKALAPYIFSVKLELGDPVMGSNQKAAELPYTISLYSTPQTYELSDLIITTLSALKLSPEQAYSVKQMNLPYYSMVCKTRYMFNVEGELRTDPARGSAKTKDTYWKNDEPWNQPLIGEVLWRNSYGANYSYCNYYYAPFPYGEIVDEILELLPSYCIMDNLGNQYMTQGYATTGHDPSGLSWMYRCVVLKEFPEGVEWLRFRYIEGTDFDLKVDLTKEVRG